MLVGPRSRPWNSPHPQLLDQAHPPREPVR
jgi:hypothetical protein